MRKHFPTILTHVTPVNLINQVARSMGSISIKNLVDEITKEVIEQLGHPISDRSAMGQGNVALYLSINQNKQIIVNSIIADTLYLKSFVRLQLNQLKVNVNDFQIGNSYIFEMKYLLRN